MQSLPDATVSVSPGDCARAMLDGMPQVMWFIRRHMRKNRARGLTVPAFRTLVLLDRYPHANLSLVAEHLGATLPTASRIVTGLVGRGMVRRAPSREDRRQVVLVLTAKGRAAFESARQGTQDEVAAKVADLSADDRETVARAMTLLGTVFACRAACPEPAAKWVAAP